MHILHVAAFFAPAYCYGGPPRTIWSLCRGLQIAGVDVQVFTTTANGTDDLPVSPSEGERYHGVAVRYFKRTFPRRFFGAAGLRDALVATGRHYDLIHVHGLWNLTVWTAMRYARLYGIPYVVSPRGMLESGAVAHRSIRKQIAYRLFERKNLEKASFVHTTSITEARTVQGYGLSVPIICLPNPVDGLDGGYSSSGTFRRSLGLSKNVPLLVFLGRLHPIKRLDLLAGAFHHVRRAYPNAHLVIAGPEEGRYRQQVEPKFGESERFVHWIGEVDKEKKWSLLADADVLVMCSDSESFGMSAAEAMAAGVPVVVTRTCPWEEIEKHGCGFWVAQNAQSIADGIVNILKIPARAKEMGERGKALIRDKYSSSAIAHAMADHYAAVICHPRGTTL